MAQRDSVLSDEELNLLWDATDQLGPPFGPLFKLLVLTGQRREEVAGVGRRTSMLKDLQTPGKPLDPLMFNHWTTGRKVPAVG